MTPTCWGMLVQYPRKGWCVFYHVGLREDRWWIRQEVLEIRNRGEAKSLVWGASTCPFSKYLRTCYAPAALPGVGDRTVSKRPEGGEGAGWRDHSEASQLRETELGRGNSQCLVGSGRPVWLGWGEHGGVAGVIGDATREGMEG